MSDTIKPVAWRVECRWADPSKGGDWRKYADYGTLLAAQTSQQRFANFGDIEARIVPLVRAEDALNEIERLSKELAWERVVSQRYATELAELRAAGEMVAAVAQGAKEEFVRVPYGASHEDVAQINDWHKMANEALSQWNAAYMMLGQK